MATKARTTGKAEQNDRGEVPRVDRADKKKASPPQAEAKSRGKNTIASLGADPAYLALIQRFSLRPIRTDTALDAAALMIDELIDRDDLSPAESDYLDALGDLVEKYEDEHVEMIHVNDVDMFNSIMDEKGVRQAEVVRGTGLSKTVLSLVLNGKRDLTREHIETLAKYFRVNPAAFLGSA